MYAFLTQKYKVFRWLIRAFRRTFAVHLTFNCWNCETLKPWNFGILKLWNCVKPLLCIWNFESLKLVQFESLETKVQTGRTFNFHTFKVCKLSNFHMFKVCKLSSYQTFILSFTSLSFWSNMIFELWKFESVQTLGSLKVWPWWCLEIVLYIANTKVS